MQKRKSLGLLLTLPLALALTACSGSVDDKTAGYDAMQAQDWATAATHLDAALAATDKATDGAEFKRLSLAVCKALAHTDAKASSARFVAFAAANEFDAKDVADVVRAFISAKKFEEGLAVLDAGLKKYKENADLLPLLERYKEIAKNDTSLNKALQGLGYVN